MTECRKCKATVSENATFCPRCGETFSRRGLLTTGSCAGDIGCLFVVVACGLVICLLVPLLIGIAISARH